MLPYTFLLLFIFLLVVVADGGVENVTFLCCKDIGYSTEKQFFQSKLSGSFHSLLSHCLVNISTQLRNIKRTHALNSRLTTKHCSGVSHIQTRDNLSIWYFAHPSYTDLWTWLYSGFWPAEISVILWVWTLLETIMIIGRYTIQQNIEHRNRGN